MTTRHRKAQVTGQYIHDLIRRRALAAVEKEADALSKSYDKIAAGIRKDLRALGYSVKEVRAVIEKHFAGTRDERVRAIEEAIRFGAQEGRKLDSETFDAVFGKQEGDSDTRPLAAPSSAPVIRLCERQARESEDE
jgi:hypothetical protein